MNNKEDIQFDNLIREKLADFTVSPSMDLWDAIAEKLSRKKRRKLIVLYRIVAMAAMVVMAFVTGWYINSLREIPKLPSGVTTERTTTPEIQKNDAINNNKTTIISGEPVSSGNAVSINKSGRLAASEQGSIMTPETIPSREIYYFSKLDLKPCLIKSAEFENQLVGIVVREMNQEVTIVNTGKNEEFNVERSKIKVPENRWSLGIFASPDYSSYSARHSFLYAQNMTYEGSRGSSNVGGGISVQYKTSKKWSLESGIYYSQKGQRSVNSKEYVAAYAGGDPKFAFAAKSFLTTPVNIVQGKIAMNSVAGIIEFSGIPRNSEIAADLVKTGAFSNNMLLQGEVSQVFNFMEVPLFLRYQLINSKIGVQIMGGVNTNIIVGNNVYLLNGTGSENIGKTGDIRTINYSGTVGMGVSYGFLKHLSFNVEPRFNYYLYSLSTNNDVNFRPYRIGFYTGISYNF